MSKSLTYQNRLMVSALVGGVVPLLVAVVLIYQTGTPPGVALLVSTMLLGSWLWAGLTLRAQVTEPMGALANMIEALREGDYTLRGRCGPASDALSEVYNEVNALSDFLRDRRGRRFETSALVAKLMETVDVAICTFDAEGQLVNMNRYASDLIGTESIDSDATAESLGMQQLLVPGSRQAVAGLLGTGDRRWQVSCQSFREFGRAHFLLVASDVSSALRHEELKAWRRLIRVISHELNNSLTPIRTLSESMLKRLQNEPLVMAGQPEMRSALLRALELIASRASGLAQFVGRYAELARLPTPVLRIVDVGLLIERICRLEGVRPTGNWSLGATGLFQIEADAVQIEQALINLIRNAKDAVSQQLTIEPGYRSEVSVNLIQESGCQIIEVIDNGVGLRSQDNIFVPFFTTKPQGSGIGLVLARQIIESHSGALSLDNNADQAGCIARVTLPTLVPDR